MHTFEVKGGEGGAISLKVSRAHNSCNIFYALTFIRDNDIRWIYVKTGTADMPFCQTLSKLLLLRISPMLNSLLSLISRSSSQSSISSPQYSHLNLQSCEVDFQSVGLDDYERDRRTDQLAWRQKSCLNIRLSSSSSYANTNQSSESKQLSTSRSISSGEKTTNIVVITSVVLL